jgi:hypothetical protein
MTSTARSPAFIELALGFFKPHKRLLIRHTLDMAEVIDCRIDRPRCFLYVVCGLRMLETKNSQKRVCARWPAAATRAGAREATTGASWFMGA